MKRFLIPILALSLNPAHAEVVDLDAATEATASRTMTSGNALISPQSVLKVVKEVIVQTLQKDYDAKSEYGGLSLSVQGGYQSLRIPEKPLLKEIMNTLGISRQVQVSMEPIKVAANFGPDSFQLKIENVGPNLFSIRALWEVKELVAESKALRVIVPKGAFDQSFSITSSPVKIGLKAGTGPITALLEMTAKLSNEGSKITLDRFKTNLSDNRTRLKLKLGKLTVGGKPLQLDIVSNGQTLSTDEATIREQFQDFEPELMQNIQKELAVLIQAQFSELSDKLNNQNPFKVSFNSSEVLEKYKLKNASLKELFKDINADFVFSYIQELPEQNFFSTQVASQICIAKDCISNKYAATKIGTTDIANMMGRDAGVILYESWLQNIINSDVFQKRVAKYYQKNLKSPGVALGKSGIKLHFNSSKNAIVAVVNLVIDIKATTPPNSLKNAWEFTKNSLADAWENIAGSGQYVYLPVEITAKIKGIQKDSSGKRVLMIETEIPFHKNGTITNTYNYPSNVMKMNKGIRKELLSSVQEEIGSSLPKTITLPLDEPMDLNGVKFDINQVLMTKNNGLLVSGYIK